MVDALARADALTHLSVRRAYSAVASIENGEIQCYEVGAILDEPVDLGPKKCSYGISVCETLEQAMYWYDHQNAVPPELRRQQMDPRVAYARSLIAKPARAPTRPRLPPPALPASAAAVAVAAPPSTTPRATPPNTSRAPPADDAEADATEMTPLVGLRSRAHTSSRSDTL